MNRVMRKIGVLSVLFIVCLGVKAQKEIYNWHFGTSCGITWNSTRDLLATGLFGTGDVILKGLPTNLVGSKISASEGCFSLSDTDGNLLFYSDGRTVWNKENVQMPQGSGLLGDASSAQAGIVLPYPGSITKYIVATVGQQGAGNAAYSVVDMTTNPLGEVMAAYKNIRFQGAMGTTSETITSIRHSNRRDYWVIAPGVGSPAYLNAWLMTDVGAAAQPVISEVPGAVTSLSAGGYLKITPDGKTFVWGSNTSGKLVFGDFNNTTGECTNIRMISMGNPYGVEFSVSMNYLYIGTVTGLAVFDFKALLAAADPTKVLPKTYVIGGSSVRAVQLGPDGRMYIPARSSKSLTVIDNPEEGDNLRIYQLPADFLTGTAQFGLPSFAASWFRVAIDGNKTPCIDGEADYSTVINYSIADSRYDNLRYFEWNWGDGSPVEKDYNVSVGANQYRTHVYRSGGVQTLTVTPYVENSPGVFTPLINSSSIVINPRSCFLPVNPHLHSNFKK
ncbi:hypothetical protein CLV62_106112 [Dysgonomonas alginatilytica]|uniref:PKD domain-containing protein n=2 Tax=Dysgonomonas alginatilytica TaxID=1605892 RepID=A0A2V3PSN2_9BACT|nr:hypothetical protein CLV62_106112 [Dysgonomonas alginatilytica]